MQHKAAICRVPWHVLLCAFLVASMCMGCRITRQSSADTAPAPEPSLSTGSTRSTTVAADGNLPETSLRDYADLLKVMIGRAQEQARRNEFPGMKLPNSPLAMANMYLSIIEARLPETLALAELQRASQLILARRPREAAQVLDDLALHASAKNTAIKADDIQDLIRSVLSDRPQQALPHISNITADLAARPQLIDISVIRTDLQDASGAASRERATLLDAALADATARTTKLKASLGTQ